MNFSDIVKMCMDSLKRRRGRTILTVLGVFIGCASIIIMVSIGAGMRESSEQMIADMGDVTIIEVYGGSSEAKLDEKAIENFSSYDGVQAAMGKAQFGEYETAASAGVNDRYREDWVSVVGMDLGTMEDMGFELLEGQFPVKDDEIAVGQYFAYNFYDSLMPEGKNYVDRFQWDEEGNMLDPEDPFFSPLNTRIKLKLSTYDENAKEITREFTVTGILKEDYGKGWETSEGLFMSAAAMKKMTAELSGLTESLVKLNYSEILVKATDIDMVTTVEDNIKSLGYYTSSMESMRESLKQEARQIELMLGGLGAISLLVAAIGITNTMTMSITERTKEIGVMKALGCYVKDIRMMFLMEAGSIGLIGGVLGLLFSYLVSIVINLIAFNALNSGITWEQIKYALIGNPDAARISVITPGLVVFAIVFSFGVGLLSGYHPANKAVKISALEAIRDE